jgi:homoserine dehydrogenase
MSVVRVGLLGVGTVGGGVWKALRSQERKLAQRLGKRVQVVKALVRNLDKERPESVDHNLLTTCFSEVLESGVDIVVEVMGGVDPAYEYVRSAIEKGCHVVTANKELLAKHGRELIELANRHRVHLAYEASVAGGIPILNVLRQFLRTNDITAVQGILNGTTNYILTQMEREGRPYAEVLKEAQALGYAEADPTSDVEGYDALYKLYILSQLVFGESLPLNRVDREGITRLSPGHIRLAKELGFRIKLLAQANKADGGLHLSVRPTAVPLDHPLARVQDAFNAVQVRGNLVGDLFFTGKGAGELPTASAVVEDLAYLLTQPFSPQPHWQERSGQGGQTVSSSQTCLLYLESDQPECSPDQLLQTLQQAGVQITSFKVEYSKAEVLRLALVGTGVAEAARQLSAGPLNLTASWFPILSPREESGEAETQRLLHPSAAAAL